MVEPGYLIVLARVFDRSAFAAYVRALPPVYQQFGGRYLALAAPADQYVPNDEVLPAPQSLVVSVWPSFARLQEFWWSTLYQEVAKLRANTGEFHVGALAGKPVGSEHTRIAVGLDATPLSQVFASGAPLRLEGQALGKIVSLLTHHPQDFKLKAGRVLSGPLLPQASD
jgi:uncharacterized protein (DUF1330 family)